MTVVRSPLIIIYTNSCFRTPPSLPSFSTPTIACRPKYHATAHSSRRGQHQENIMKIKSMRSQTAYRPGFRPAPNPCHRDSLHHMSFKTWTGRHGAPPLRSFFWSLASTSLFSCSPVVVLPLNECKSSDLSLTHLLSLLFFSYYLSSRELKHLGAVLNSPRVGCCQCPS
ncbi:hypothetical protein OG21DRAFT_1228691 [Imleria badia]|nr:hypothetical protein OG21DRAFT_1228691 [Imleria badia]